MIDTSYPFIFFKIFQFYSPQIITAVWSGRGVMVLVILPLPWLPSNFDTNSITRAYCAGSTCALGLFGHFSRLLSLFCLPLSGRWPNIDWNTVSEGR